jgi:peptidoglycan/xylan/chitin deacetylase (PgdA/CDA1 family)
MTNQQAKALQHYPWPGGKRWAFALTIDVDGESPFLWRMRETPISNIAEREQRRFGPTIGVYRLVNMCEKLGVPATFFVPGYIAETYPDIVPTLAEKNFEIGVHGYLHEPPDEVSEFELERVTRLAIDILAKQSGRSQFGYRSPRFHVTDNQIDMISRLGLLYDSSLMRQETPYRYRGVTEIPVYWGWEDGPFFRYTGPDRNSWMLPTIAHVEQVWRDECDGIRTIGGVFVLTIHPYNSGRASRVALLERLMQWVLGRSDVWVANLGQIAGHHNQVFPQV